VGGGHGPAAALANVRVHSGIPAQPSVHCAARVHTYIRRKDAPFRSSTEPLANYASGEARKRTAAATSSFVARAAQWTLCPARLAPQACECIGGHIGVCDPGRHRGDGNPVRAKRTRERLTGRDQPCLACSVPGLARLTAERIPVTRR
jgi:hypothetical protein